MLGLCSLGKLTWGHVTNSAEGSGWGSASTLFEGRRYGLSSKALGSKQKEAVLHVAIPNLVIFSFNKFNGT